MTGCTTGAPIWCSITLTKAGSHGCRRRAPAKYADARSKPPKMTATTRGFRSLYLLHQSLHQMHKNAKPISQPICITHHHGCLFITSTPKLHSSHLSSDDPTKNSQIWPSITPTSHRQRCPDPTPTRNPSPFAQSRSSIARCQLPIDSHDHQTPISSSRSAILSASIRPVDGRHPHLLPSSSTVSHKLAADHLHLAVTAHESRPPARPASDAHDQLHHAQHELHQQPILQIHAQLASMPATSIPSSSHFLQIHAQLASTPANVCSSHS
ncbi:hypothetical protein ACLOJK_015721 [Asimina triloba]